MLPYLAPSKDKIKKRFVDMPDGISLNVTSPINAALTWEYPFNIH